MKDEPIEPIMSRIDKLWDKHSISTKPSKYNPRYMSKEGFKAAIKEIDQNIN